MFKIIIHVLKMEINCILMKYILMKYDLMCMIISHVFQMDIICILIKYYLNVYDRNSCISKILYLYFN